MCFIKQLLCKLQEQSSNETSGQLHTFATHETEQPVYKMHCSTSLEERGSFQIEWT